MNKSQNSAIKQLFQENKLLTFLVPVFLVALIILAAVHLLRTDKSIEASLDESVEAGFETENQVIILPQLTRSIDDESNAIKKDPFKSPILLTGIIYSEERSLAILVSDDLSCIVGVDDTVGDSLWKVLSINKKSVTLTNGSENLTLEISEKR